MVGYPRTLYLPHSEAYLVQSMATKIARGSSCNALAAAVNSGFVCLQWPHPGEGINYNNNSDLRYSYRTYKEHRT